VGVAYAKVLGAASLASLRAIPADTLVRQAARTQEHVDGWVLPAEIRRDFRGEETRQRSGDRRLDRR
jgi:hypothetical protein